MTRKRALLVLAPLAAIGTIVALSAAVFAASPSPAPSTSPSPSQTAPAQGHGNCPNM